MGGKQCEYTNLCPDGRPMGRRGCDKTAFPNLPQRRRCEREAIFEPQLPNIAKLGRRRILLVNGELSALIRSYADESGRVGVHVNWERSQVIYVGESEQLRILNAPDAARSRRGLGRSAFSITIDAAKGVASADLRDPEAVRARRKLDLRCGAVD